MDTKSKKQVVFKPTMDFLRAKQTLGIKSSLTYDEISVEHVQSKFVLKNTQV